VKWERVRREQGRARGAGSRVPSPEEGSQGAREAMTAAWVRAGSLVRHCRLLLGKSWVDQRHVWKASGAPSCSSTSEGIPKVAVGSPKAVAGAGAGAGAGLGVGVRSRKPSPEPRVGRSCRRTERRQKESGLQGEGERGLVPSSPTSGLAPSSASLSGSESRAGTLVPVPTQPSAPSQPGGHAGWVASGGQEFEPLEGGCTTAPAQCAGAGGVGAQDSAPGPEAPQGSVHRRGVRDGPALQRAPHRVQGGAESAERLYLGLWLRSIKVRRT